MVGMSEAGIHDEIYRLIYNSFDESKTNSNNSTVGCFGEPNRGALSQKHSSC
jgi:hypothetical protein